MQVCDDIAATFLSGPLVCADIYLFIWPSIFQKLTDGSKGDMKPSPLLFADNVNNYSNNLRFPFPSWLLFTETGEVRDGAGRDHRLLNPVRRPIYMLAAA